MHLPTLFVAASAFVTALAAPATEPVASNNDIGVSLFERASLFERTDTGNGINGGFYYSFYNAGGGTVDFENKAAGEYSVTCTSSYCSTVFGTLTRS
jgi:endo-1,4-beta-xylanase